MALIRQELIDGQAHLIAAQRVALDEALARLGICIPPEPELAPKRPTLRVVGDDE